jgi:DNA-binding NarL/FixJ family response regulator
MIRVILADDHTIVREGLQQLLRAAGGFEVVGEARDAFETLQQVRSADADVLLLDISMPGRSGLELIKQIRTERPRLRILVLSMHHEHQYAIRAIKAGASGYLTKDSASTQLATALRKVASGGAYITAEVAEQLALGAMPQTDAAPHTTLSDREFQVLRMIVAGRSVTDIANELSLSVKTVSSHKARMMQKLGVGNPSELFRYAMEHRLTGDDAPGSLREWGEG